MLVELAGAKFPFTCTMQGVQKIIKIIRVYWKMFSEYFLETGWIEKCFISSCELCLKSEY